LRINAAAVQLAMLDADVDDPVARWWALPEPTRAGVLSLLARLIARGVLAGHELPDGPGTVEAGNG
jgi:hypothetical protein